MFQSSKLQLPTEEISLTANDEIINKLIVSFRGQKVELPVTEGTTVAAVKSHVISKADPGLNLLPSDVDLLYKGKKLVEVENPILNMLSTSKTSNTYRLMATGASSLEIQQYRSNFDIASQQAPRIRDDLSRKGQLEIAKRQHLGRSMMQRAKQSVPSSIYKFGTIEVLPNLPDMKKAQEILTSLANDPGILACMELHKWKVGSLAELYPDGKVGESAVCVMGLNTNNGQKISLRIRTDDLKGFRKILSIRKVLFHELAHNVHSEHDGKFFQLMRQIERECSELDWTNGHGLSGAAENATVHEFTAGTYRLGGSSLKNVPVRELAARAATSRMTEEELEIQQSCGCGQKAFLPNQLLEEGVEKNEEHGDSTQTN